MSCYRKIDAVGSRGDTLTIACKWVPGYRVVGVKFAEPSAAHVPSCVHYPV